MSAINFALGEPAADDSLLPVYAALPDAATGASFCFAATASGCDAASAFEAGTAVTLAGGAPGFRAAHTIDPVKTSYIVVNFKLASGQTATRAAQIIAKGTDTDTVAGNADNKPNTGASSGQPAEDTTCSDLVSNPQKRQLYTNPSNVPLTDVERQMICYTLNVRVLKAGGSPMVVDPTLMKNSRDWAAANARDHAPDRHSGQNVAENAFYSVPTAKAAVDGWEASPPHYANIVGPYTKIGVGVAYEDGGQGIPHWIEQFIW